MKNVSFIIPNYNAQNTIAKCIESILSQKYKGKIEVVVIDDFSKDDSVKVISKYKVKLIKNKKNLGLARSLNLGIKKARHELISIIWCDCVLENKNWLNEMVKTYNSNKKIAVVASKLIIPKKYWNKFSFYDKVVLVKDYEISLNKKQKDGRPSLFSKKVLFECNLYDDKIFRIAGEDTDLIWKIKEKGYEIVTSNVNVLHLHGFYNLGFKKQLFNKALPLAEAIGVNFSLHGIKSLPNRYWSPITLTIIYLGLFIPFIKFISFFFTISLIIIFTLKVFKYVKDKKMITIPFFKLFKDILTIIGFWKGVITKKQEF